MSNPNTPIYPPNAATDLNLLIATDNAQGALASAMTAGQTTLTLVAGAAAFQVPCVVTVNSEAIILPTAASEQVFSGITRGAQGTTAASHLIGAGVFDYVMAWHHNQLAAEIESIESSALINGFVAGLTNATIRRAIAISLVATTNTDLYTVPAGRRAMIASYTVFNPGIGACTFTCQMKLGGVGSYLPITAPATLATLATAANGQSTPLYFEAGDILSFNVSASTGVGLTVWMCIIEFTYGPCRSVKTFGLNTGDNTIYTCPAGKGALLGAVSYLAITGAVWLQMIADSGGARTFTPYIVPSGQSNAPAYQYAAAKALSASTQGTFTEQPVSLTTGDFVVLNVSIGAAGQVAWVNVIEF